MPVVDASVVVDWIVPGVGESASAMSLLEVLVQNGEPLHAPRLLLEEVANALLTGIRASRWSGSEADQSWLWLRELPVALSDQPRDLERAWELARRFDDHPVYDMLYVALAERRAMQLVTADARLRRRLVGLDWVLPPEQMLP